MGRYRPPREKGSPYITPAGKQRLDDELTQLWRVERPQVTRAVAEAAAQGDRSENAEYIYGKKRLAEIDRRVRYLRKRLDELKVVEGPPADRSRVYFGARVGLENVEGEPFAYRIVGPDEIEPDRGCISMDSPLARALLGKPEGEEVTVQLPKGEVELVIVMVSYVD